jgi:hypothetical protein
MLTIGGSDVLFAFLIIEVLTRGQSNNKEWFNQRAGKLLITKLVSIPKII